MTVALSRPASVSSWRHVRAIVSLPLTNTVLIPAAIVATNGTGTGLPFRVGVPSAARLAVGIGLLEEPALAARFGRHYAEYCRHVPRWVPRRTPWVGPRLADACGEGSER